jgi:hypothetical protein
MYSDLTCILYAEFEVYMQSVNVTQTFLNNQTPL